jgi:glycosyltransferase involved in cell wall biosynthesis
VRIAFLVERPTQFEAPFYRFAARDPEHELRVIFLAPDAASPAFDTELSRPVDWGIDLLGGYPHRLCPQRGRARFLAREIDPARTDLLIVNGYTRPPYLAANALARRRGIATALRLDTAVFPATGAPSARERLRRRLFTAVVARAYDLFLGAGSLTLDYLRTCGVPRARTGLFPYAVDVESFRERARLSGGERQALRARLGIPAAAPVVLALAKLNRREAPWDLVAALPRVEREGIWTIVAGDGPERAALARAAAERGLARVRFVGYVPYPELPALYAAVDLFVHAAREERWGVSIEEALACGLPAVAASTVGAGYDLIEDGKNGFRYPSGDGAALARAIDRALALDRAAVEAASGAVLARWDYAAAWRGLVAAARTATDARALRGRRERAA